ncbi:hypothetical protein K466DRAFT_254620 [Polyporus arcularius HHB13444]|uniref:Uncharacterized protein n=1 Tax=Polyporus arcularius HHB13444 TaxID=1314778 RepID=A0A5C3P5S5_9APHY|nr:hypothetical protein K466DRAFT_254620 [Polyporus arcularius HHB13444]
MMAQPHEKRLSVIHPKPRVHGVRGLGVRETSVLPEITGSHTGTSTLVWVEECADILGRALESRFDGIYQVDGGERTRCRLYRNCQQMLRSPRPSHHGATKLAWDVSYIPWGRLGATPSSSLERGLIDLCAWGTKDVLMRHMPPATVILLTAVQRLIYFCLLTSSTSNRHPVA